MCMMYMYIYMYMYMLCEVYIYTTIRQSFKLSCIYICMSVCKGSLVYNNRAFISHLHCLQNNAKRTFFSTCVAHDYSILHHFGNDVKYKCNVRNPFCNIFDHTIIIFPIDLVYNNQPLYILYHISIVSILYLPATCW